MFGAAGNGGGGVFLVIFQIFLFWSSSSCSSSTIDPVYNETDNNNNLEIWSVYFDDQNDLIRPPDDDDGGADDKKSFVVHQLIDVPFDNDRFITEIQVYLDEVNRNDDDNDGIIRMELTGCHQIDGEDLFHSTLPLDAIFDDAEEVPFICLQRLASVHYPRHGQVVNRFPDGVGLRFARRRQEDGIRQMLLLTIEYADREDPIDHSGFDLTVIDAQAVPMIEAGILAIGVVPDFRFFIPPKLNHWSMKGVCMNGCFDDKMMMTESINIVGVVIGANHRYLDELTIEIIDRQGSRQIFSYPGGGGNDADRPRSIELNMDHDHQTSSPVAVIQAKDKLVVQCAYHTEGNNNKTIRAGFEGNTENCLAWLHYYPRIESSLDACLSSHSLATIMSILDLDNVDVTINKSSGLELTIQRKPRRLSDFLKEKDQNDTWNRSKLIRAKYSSMKGRQVSQCGWNPISPMQIIMQRRRRKR